MKKQYESPDMEVIIFESEDIITTSNPDKYELPIAPSHGQVGM